MDSLLDTGASVSVIQYDLFTRLSATLHRTLLLRPAAPLQGVAGEKLHVLGSTEIKVDGLSKPVTVRVIKGLNEQLIFGCDLLNDSVIDLVRGFVQIEGKQWPIKRHSPLYTTVCTILPDTGNIELNQLLRNSADVFSTPEVNLGRCIHPPMSIKSTGPPICQPAYMTPLLKRRIIDECIDDMLHQGIIRPSTSPWSSPITLVKKPDDSTRFCVDYRKLNAVTVSDSYPLALISDILDQIGNSTIFTTLDLKAGYWQIEMEEQSIPKTAFRCHRGLYEFLRLPFGLKNGPAAFQRIMDTVLSGLIGHIAMVYLDDIVIYSNNRDEHINHIRLVFDRLRKAGLRLNTNKCHFGLREIKLLGFIVSEKGVTTDPDKVKVIKNLPAPTSVKQVRSFIGACSYYRSLVPDFSKTAEDLIKLTRNNVKFHWGPDQEIAFNKLKDLLVSSDVMAAPQLDKPYKLYTDACGYADRLCHGILQMGYIGLQVLCEVGGELPALGTALRSWTSQLRVGMPRILTAQT